jgi:hypothetical protein
VKSDQQRIQYLEDRLNALENLLTAKGSLWAATAKYTAGGLAVGANDTTLVADSAQTLGVKWQALSSWTALTEAAQDAAGAMLVDTDTIDLTYTDATPALTADLKHVGAHVRHDATQALTTATTTVIAFNQERWDTHAFHDNSTNNSRLTIPSGKTGKYIVSAGIVFEANATGVRYIDILKNGTTALRSVEVSASSAFETMLTISAIVNLAATDYVQVRAFQDSGGNLNVLSVAEYTPEFELAFLGS